MMSLKTKWGCIVSSLLIVGCAHSAADDESSGDDSAISIRRARPVPRRKPISLLEAAALQNASNFKGRWAAKVASARGYIAKRHAVTAVLDDAQEELIFITHNHEDGHPPSPASDAADNWAPQSEADAFEPVSLYHAEFNAALEADGAAVAARADDPILRLMNELKADFARVLELQFDAWTETTLNTLWKALYEASHARLQREAFARAYHQALVLDPAQDDAIFDHAPPPLLNLAKHNDVFDPDLLPR